HYNEEAITKPLRFIEEKENIRKKAITKPSQFNWKKRKSRISHHQAFTIPLKKKNNYKEAITKPP
ncbi:35178_t:CDS:1, partial [Gigaspora margarita]